MDIKTSVQKQVHIQNRLLRAHQEADPSDDKLAHSGEQKQE
jgi:hypothetical protein